MPKRTKANVLYLAKKNGIDMSIEFCGFWTIECWAPAGSVWKCNGGCHFLSVEGDGYYTRPDWSETFADIEAAIAFGFEKCQDDDCDVCASARGN